MLDTEQVKSKDSLSSEVATDKRLTTEDILWSDPLTYYIATLAIVGGFDSIEALKRHADLGEDFDHQVNKVLYMLEEAGNIVIDKDSFKVLNSSFYLFTKENLVKNVIPQYIDTTSRRLFKNLIKDKSNSNKDYITYYTISDDDQTREELRLLNKKIMNELTEISKRSETRKPKGTRFVAFLNVKTEGKDFV